MSHSSLFERCQLVPVITIEDAAHARPLAEALLAAGINALEITLRTPTATDAIRAASEVPGLLVGAGSIRRTDQLPEVAAAGAQFCVSPGSTTGLLDAAEQLNMPLIPGVATASEMLRLMERGYFFLKFFPAEVNGGVSALKALSAPMPEARFFPTGGIHAGNAANYLALDNVVCVGGSWFVPADAMRAGDFSQIESLARQAMEACGDH